jgi:hypothetical protein
MGNISLSLDDAGRETRATPTVSPSRIMGTATNICSWPPAISVRELTLIPELNAVMTSGAVGEATGASGEFPTSANTDPSAPKTVTLDSENSAANTLAA